MATITDKIKAKLAKILKIRTDYPLTFTVDRTLTYEGNAAKNTIWYDGNSDELAQFFSQLPTNSNSFWGAVESNGMEIRKFHSGIPRLLVNTLSNITLADMNEFYFKKEENRKLWNEMAKDNNIERLVNRATKNVLKVGDGAFKISFNENITKLPIVEFYPGPDVDYTYVSGRLREIKFYTRYTRGYNEYVLEEIYGYGYIKYRLFKDDKECPLETLEETEMLEDVYFDSKLLLAVPYMIFESETYKGRGQSIYDGKSDAFDALDEVISQWLDAIRSGRVKTYIPESLIPRDMTGGFLLSPNSFDNKFIKVGASLKENAQDKIDTIQPDIQVEAYEKTYSTNLDLCLQGLISPSTLGIDVKKLDNAESQREKEKTTLYTRQSIIDALQMTLKELVQVMFDAYNLEYDKPIEEISVEINFGGYANPSFETLITTMSNPCTPMSIEAKVDEIWGDTKTLEWKEKEVQRIKEEQGLDLVKEPNFAKGYQYEKLEKANSPLEIKE